MSASSPIIIVFPPSPELSGDFQHLLSQLRLPKVNCQEAKDLPTVLSRYPNNIPVICMPFALTQGRSGVNETLQIRSQAEFRAIKILGLLTLFDKISMHSFFGAGADIVLQPPFDIDLISLQLQALAKSTFEQQDLHNSVEQNREITRSTMRFLDTTRDGVLIIDDSGQLITANRAGERILALTSEDSTASYKAISSQFDHYLEYHRQQEIEEQSIAELVTSADASIRRGDGRSARIMLRIMSLKGPGGNRAGFAIGLGDLSIPRQLASKLSSQEKMRTLTLILAASALELLKSPSLGVPGHPLRLAEQSLLQSKSPVLLSQVMTPLLEVLDLILPTRAEVRVTIRDDARILASRADLFQLLGSLLLFAADRAGSQGETTIESLFDQSGENLAVIFSYTAHEVTEPISGDYFATLLYGDHSRFLNDGDTSVQSLKFAQQFAEKIGVQIEASSTSKWSGKFRVLLPCELE